MAEVQKVPSSERIMREAATELGYDRMSHEEVRESFDCIMSRIESRMLVLYERYEEQVNAAKIPRRLFDETPDALRIAEDTGRRRGFREGALVLFSRLYPALRREFASVAQSRRSRGGKSFEHQFAYVLRPGQASHLKSRTAIIEPISSCQVMPPLRRTAQYAP